MRSPTDPILVLRRRVWIIRGLAVAALVLAAIWGMFPPPPAALPDISLDPPLIPATNDARPDRLLAQLDPKVFSARLWNPLPVPPPPVPPPPPRAAKPDVTLVAVIERSGGNGGLRAALYDPAAQRVRVLDPGAIIGPYTIAGITSDGVTLQEGQWTHELRLREEKPPSPLMKLISESMPQAPRIRAEP